MGRDFAIRKKKKVFPETQSVPLESRWSVGQRVCVCVSADSHWPADDQVTLVGPVGQTHARVGQPAGRVDADVAPLVRSHGVDHVEDHLRQHAHRDTQTHTRRQKTEIGLLTFPVISWQDVLESELFPVCCLFSLKFKQQLTPNWTIKVNLTEQSGSKRHKRRDER